MANEPHRQPLDKPTSAFKLWWVAIRPFSLTATLIPVLTGTVLAVTVGHAALHLLSLIGAVAGMLALQIAANLFNDVYDYQKGLDRQVHPASGAVVRGWLTQDQGLTAAWCCIGIGGLIGIGFVIRIGLSILMIGLCGALSCLLYSRGPLAMKYHALGDLAVFVNLGLLGCLGAWTVQTGTPSWIPVLWSVPMGLLVIAILHANNWRDIQTDRQGGIRTVATLFGDAASRCYYRVLLYGPFVYIGAMILVTSTFGLDPRMPWTFILTFIALPDAMKLDRAGATRHDPEKQGDFMALDSATGRLNLVFGVLYITAALLASWLC